MKTLSMMNEAERTGKTYIAKDMRYSAENGFFDSNGKPWAATAFRDVNDIMNVGGWKLLETDIKKMTLKEIEDKLGHRVELVSR
jgi:hypothetical protein